MSAESRQSILRQQRAAVLRAIEQARARQENEDVEILQSVVNLLDDLHDLAPRVFKPRLH